MFANPQDRTLRHTCTNGSEARGAWPADLMHARCAQGEGFGEIWRHGAMFSAILCEVQFIRLRRLSVQTRRESVAWALHLVIVKAQRARRATPQKDAAMNDIWAGLEAAFWLIVTLDADLVEITLRSLQVSLSALVVASLIALPFGTWLAIRRFRYRRTAIAVSQCVDGLAACGGWLDCLFVA